MADDPDIPISVWDKCKPTSLDLARGASWFYFSSDTINFVLKNSKREVIEQKVYKREDKNMRDLCG